MIIKGDVIAKKERKKIMTLIVNGKRKNVTLQYWDRDHWSPDMFGDFELSYKDEQEIDEDTYKDLVEFWDDAVDDYNNGVYTEVLGYRYVVKDERGYPNNDEPWTPDMDTADMYEYQAYSFYFDD